jgi:hypothetical protein
MNMKSEIYSAYVAGLCPLQVLMKHGPDSHRKCVPAPAGDEVSADLPCMPSRRQRVLLLILALGLAIGAWQLLSRSDETPAAAVPAQVAASGKGVLLVVLIVGLTIGAGEFFSRIDETRAAAVPARHAASHNSVLNA